MTENIKLPPMPQTIENRLSDFAVACAFGQHELRASAARELRQAIEEHAREAVRMNAQADIRTLIADDAYAMTFQSLGQYRSALLAALSAAPAAPQPAQPAQPLTDEQINEGRQALPYDIEDKPEPWSFKEGVRFAERKHLGVKND